MGDLEKFIPADTQIVDAIYDYYKTEGDKEEPRGYLGASIIGHVCERYLWYTFRGCTKENFPGRLYRLFETGNLEEVRMVKDLRDIGCEIHEVDPRTGKQFEVNAVSGHFSGHMDGCVLGVPTAPKTWHVFEGKTHNAKSYKKLIREGVQKSKPQHYAQMQVYMHLTGMKRALYLARNKDTDDLYAERIRYDKVCAKRLMQKARRIIFAPGPPARITERVDWHECRYCSAHDLCWSIGEVALPIPAVNCRQCCHATPEKNGIGHWTCRKHGRGLSAKDQITSCSDHLVLPGLLSFAEPTRSGKVTREGIKTDEEYIGFRNKDGKEWFHGKSDGHFSTAELCTIPISALVSTMLVRAKGLFGAEASGSFTDDILSRYPECDTEIVYRGDESGMMSSWAKRYKSGLYLGDAINRVNTGDYEAVEFSGGRVVVKRLDRNINRYEIWQGKE